jgi:hypothetical protein
MDFFYQSKQTFECQYLIAPNHRFSFESFMKFCAEYVDPNFMLINKNKFQAIIIITKSSKTMECEEALMSIIYQMLVVLLCLLHS